MTTPKGLAFLVLAMVATASVACRKGGGSFSSAAPQTEDQKTLYALGLMLGRNIAVCNLSKDELAIVQTGMGDQVMKNKPAVALEPYGPKVDGRVRARQQAGMAAEKARAGKVIEDAARESGAVKTPGGAIIRTTKPGTGATPGEKDRVKVHYVGRLTDGTEFDSSIKRNEPAQFPLNGVIKC